jgi:hypothetical protein
MPVQIRRPIKAGAHKQKRHFFARQALGPLACKAQGALYSQRALGGLAVTLLASSPDLVSGNANQNRDERQKGGGAVDPLGQPRPVGASRAYSLIAYGKARLSLAALGPMAHSHNDNVGA